MFYLLDKPKGLSSFKAIKDFARQNNIKKVGHTGTLDPLATGLLLIATDADTKLIDYIDKGFKRYRAIAKFGLTSDTYDIEGEIIKTNIVIPSKEEIEKALLAFEGKSKQMPPAFSAKKINGVRAYELARNKKEVKLKTQDVEIKNIEIIDFKESVCEFELTVSRGTYIRSIIHDLGQKLLCGAIMTNLRRTEIGPLTEKDLNQEIDIDDMFIYPIIAIEDVSKIKDGKIIEYKAEDGIYGIKYNNSIIGIANIKNNFLKTRKLLGNKL